MAVKCAKCNSDNTETAKFCSECGTRLYPADKLVISQTKTLKKPKKDQLKRKTTVGKYKIIEKVGEGGMGVVYKAKDTKLDRTVALKFLPFELTKDEQAKQRFVQEAKAAAALNHPHICTIYEIDEAEEQTFISMEYIEGQSLKDKLKKGPLSIDEAKDIALQVASGLEKAHKKGIVHRDIKPANIMINDEGQAKITDFGLAKLSWGTDLTRPSTIMGTVAYMSPEQARGEEVDHRTDIWSLGAMLYEMLSGERPFKKSHEQALIHSILNEEPKPISEIRADIPRRFEEIIYKALEKDTRTRYQSIQELMKDLKTSAPITFPKAEKSIVVLPFDDMSPNKDNEYFSDGLTEEIISDLSSIQSLRVISRTSAMMLKGTKKSMKTIGRELDVQYVLEGSVRKAGNNLRITAQLIDAVSDAHLWAEKYSGTLDDVFDIQEKVSRSIVSALKLKLSTEEDRKISERPIENVRAYECYLKAMQEAWTFTEDGLARASQYLQKGLKIVGDNVLLYEGLGTVNLFYVAGGIILDQKFLEEAKEYARKIFALNPESAEGHYLLGMTAYKVGDYETALKHCKKAYSINPNHSMNLVALIIIYSEIGRFSLATQFSTLLLQIDPLNSYTYSMLGWKLTMEGRFEDALSAHKKAIEQEPQNIFYQFCYGQSLTYNNQFKEACVAFEKLQKTADVASSFFATASIHKYSLLGERTKALESINPKLEEHLEWDTELPWWLADCYAMIGEKKKAFEMLEYATSRGFLNYPFLNEYDPLLENIRGEPRFKKLMERVKHEWESFEV